MGCIYKITNTVNGKSYIGQSRYDAMKTRIHAHLNGGARGSRLVKQAVKKYGKDAFTYEILHDGIIPEFLSDLEIEAIAQYNTVAPHGYNLTYGGEGGKRSEETCRKISEVQKDKKQSPEHVQKRADANRGKKRSPEALRRISQVHKGRTRSKAILRRMSEAHKGQIPHNRSPEYGEAYQFFTSLPPSLSPFEKRQQLCAKYPNIKSRTIRSWVDKWKRLN